MAQAVGCDNAMVNAYIKKILNYEFMLPLYKSMENYIIKVNPNSRNR